MSSSVAEHSVANDVSVLAHLRETVGAYAQLTKPRIVLLFTLTGIAALVVEGSMASDPLKFFLIALGTLLTAGSANALNQYLDRDIDSVMERTRKKRPIPQGKITPNQALVFAVVAGIVATVLLWWAGNALTAFFGVFTIAFYVGVYTMWLKRTTPYNIVIGGAAGATAPLIGWAAATGTISWGAFIMFLIIFMWTPPHFWALALCVKDEYAGVSVPMLPVVKGEETTRRQIFWYTVAMIPVTLALYFTGDCGWFYLITASVLGAGFLYYAYLVLKKPDIKTYWHTFAYSIVYLLALFVMMMVDKAIV